MDIKTGLSFRGRIRVEKFAEGASSPWEVVEAENLGLTAGINEILKLATGQGGTTFTNTTAEVGIGDSNTAPSAAQTDLQAPTNKTYKPMSAGYPTAPSGGQVQFQATFGSADANYAWNEFVIKNSTSGICINRSTNSGAGFGTKVSGTTWTATATITIS